MLREFQQNPQLWREHSVFRGETRLLMVLLHTLLQLTCRRFWRMNLALMELLVLSTPGRNATSGVSPGTTGLSQEISQISSLMLQTSSIMVLLIHCNLDNGLDRRDQSEFTSQVVTSSDCQQLSQHQSQRSQSGSVDSSQSVSVELTASSPMIQA